MRVTADTASPLWHRRRLLEVDLDGGHADNIQVAAEGEEAAVTTDIVLSAKGPNMAAVQLTIPVSASLDKLPRAVAAKAV